MESIMKKVFETNSGVILYQDLDGSFISTNPAEIYCCLFEDAKNDEDILGQLSSLSLLAEINEQNGIFYDPDEKPKRVISNKRNIFVAMDSKGKTLFGIATATKMDLKVREKFTDSPVRLVAIYNL